jgi:predicted ATPase
MLALNRLDGHDRAALVEHIAGATALPEELVAQIAERTDGVPLFVEELTKALLESGLLREQNGRWVLDGPLGRLAIPATLQASLIARLDRLSAVKEVAQSAAAIGRDFSHVLIAAVSPLPPGALDHALTQLVEAGLLFRRGEPPDATYVFKHALVQDAAYATLLRGPRQALHLRIADALERHFPELLEAQPELFAQHYAEAGLAEKSVAFWGSAGRRSAARSAMAEAAAQFQKGLDQLALLPDSPERQRQELAFLSALGAALTAVKGQAAPETGYTHTRARELWEQLGSPSEFLHVPFGQSRYHAACGELDLALHLDENLLRLSRQREDAAGLVLGHYSSGRNLAFAGRFASSRSHLEEVLASYDLISHTSLVRQSGVHPHVASQAWLGMVLWCLGFPDQALAQSKAAVAGARALAHPLTMVMNLSGGVRLLSLVADDPALDEWADQLVAVATEQGFPLYHAQGTVYRGWVKVRNGDVTEGISLLRRGSSAYSATRAQLLVPHFIALLASAYEIAGQIEEAVTLLDEALQIGARTGERWLAAELHRHKGQMLLRQGDSEAAEELYLKALSIAEEQEAKLWELRAAVSLGRLRRDQGRYTEARDLLEPIYNWFTEGFDTADLKEAKAFIDELG